MKFYDPESLALLCAEVLGEAEWSALSAFQRELLLDDIEGMDAAESFEHPRFTIEELRRRIGGSANLRPYAETLEAGAKVCADRAERIARDVLQGCDASLRWSEAGYASAEDCAAALVGDGPIADDDDDIRRAAIRIVADRLAREEETDASS